MAWHAAACALTSPGAEGGPRFCCCPVPACTQQNDLLQFLADKIKVIQKHCDPEPSTVITEALRTLQNQENLRSPHGLGPGELPGSAACSTRETSGELESAFPL